MPAGGLSLLEAGPCSLNRQSRVYRYTVAMTIRCALVVVMSLALAGCSSGSQPAVTPTPTQSPSEIATASLLTLDDFPDGWKKRTLRQADGTDPACDDPPAVAGRAEADFESEVRKSVSHSVVVFQNEASAQAYSEWAKQGHRCFAQAIEEGKLDTNGTTFSDPDFEPVDLTGVADGLTAEVLRYDMRSGIAPASSVVTLYIEGHRRASSFSLAMFLSPARQAEDRNFLIALAERALERLGTD